jgi:excisionase family DNA binding protein
MTTATQSHQPLMDRVEEAARLLTLTQAELIELRRDMAVAADREAHQHDDRPAVYRVNEAAAVLTISRAQLYELLARGEIGSIEMGRRGRRISRDQIDAYLARQARDGSAG